MNPPNSPPSVAKSRGWRAGGGSTRTYGETRPAATEAMAERAFAIFAFLWAAATLFHSMSIRDNHDGVLEYALSFAAVVVLLRPSSVVRFAALLGVQLLLVAKQMPGATNHWLFTAFVNLTILFALVRLLALHRGRVSGSALFRSFAPAVRIELLILYFFAVFHKLNTAFLNPEVSCAVNHYRSVVSRFSFLPIAPWAQYAAIYGTFVVEAGIPILLVFRRTRILGVALGMLFHFTLAINPNHRFYNFSAMVLAVYFLFIPYDFVGGARRVLADTSVGRWFASHADPAGVRGALRAVGIGLAGALIVGYLVGFDLGDYSSLSERVGGVFRSVWVLYGVATIVIFLLVARAHDVVGAVRGLDSLRIGKPVMALFPALVLLNGLSPYIGLKTESSFSMFSNLTTEDRYSNHLFMPTIMRLNPYADDLVTIEASSQPDVRRRVNSGFAMTYFELVRYTSRTPNMSVTYVRDGERRVVPRVGDDPQLSRDFPYLDRKLLKFRSVDTNPAGTRCTH